MARTLPLKSALSALALIAGLHATAHAQTVRDDGNVTANPLLLPAQEAQSGENDGASAERSGRRERGRRGQGRRGRDRPVIDVDPYIEVGQILSAELTNGGDVLTYSTVAVGVDTLIATRRTQAQANVRYERRIGWGDRIDDANVISGIARARTDIIPGFSLEGGALATRTSIDGRGAGGGLFAGDRDNTADLYSVYVGPTFGRRIGDLELGAAYRFGYSRAEVARAAVLPIGARPVGRFDDSTNHALIASIGMSPYALGGLPIGWRLSGGADEVRSGQLDQRFRSRGARLDLTVPVDPTVALVGGVGYENIRLTQRAPLLDAVTGQPVVDGNGRLVSDLGQPRQIAFETDGLIWDAGVLWRPNRRTSIEGRIGRRYGSTTYTGAISWRASEDTVFAASLYDNFTTAGRQLTDSLVALPTEFDIFRNPIDGTLGGCAFGADGGSCIGNNLANLTGFGFRNRGLLASVSTRTAVWNIGAAIGYDQRRYATGNIPGIADIDGLTDESWYASLSASRPIGAQTSFASSLYASYFDSGISPDLDSLTYGANAAVSHRFNRRLSGTVATSVNAIDQDGFNTRVFASALLGVRYGF